MAQTGSDVGFRPALLVVDMQEDFCPPNGSLAVAGGRDLALTINDLLSLPFVLKVATKDFHPTDHISFAPNHEPPNNKPYESFATMINPFNSAETKQLRLWPVHCVQDTPGAEIIPEIDASRFNAIVSKGQDRRVEMYSGFADAFGGRLGASFDLAALLRKKGISDVYVVGLAGDYCVKATAMDAQREGFKTYVIEEGVESVDPSEKGWAEAAREMEEGGVSVVGVDGDAVNKVSLSLLLPSYGLMPCRMNSRVAWSVTQDSVMLLHASLALPKDSLDVAARNYSRRPIASALSSIPKTMAESGAVTYYAGNNIYIIAPPIRTASLLKIPVEVLHHICTQLEPLWLLNLANTCTTLRTVLSFEHGNKVWYNVLPPSMWRDAEQFQDEAELSQVLAYQRASAVQQPLFRRRQPLKSSLETSGFSTSTSAPSLSIFTGFIRFPQVQYDLSPIPNNSGPKAMHDLVAAMNERKPNQALGGPYSFLCNYKREVLGNVNLRRRCYICFNSKGPDGKNVHIWRWKMLLCQDCFRAYHLTIGALRLMPTIFPVVNFVRNEVYQVPSANTEIYFKPEIDSLLTFFTGLDFDTNHLVYKRWQQEAEKDRRETSTLETRRRAVRHLIVAAAEDMWNGMEPFPTPILCTETGNILGWNRFPDSPTRSSYRVFRKRFAPTHVLKTFLFPDYALCDKPHQLPYSAATGWMDDPTMFLKKSDDFRQVVTQAWIRDKARGMLSCLTDWRHTEYYRKGRGGYVTKWMDAVKEWHITRMEAELKSGAIVRMDYIAEELQGDRHYWRIHKLRIKLGLQDEWSKVMNPLPKHPERGIAVSREAYDEFQRLDQLATEAEQKQLEGIKHFNNIIRHTCVACPDTSLLLYPMGFEGMLEHLRTWHPKLYFTTDDFHPIG